MAGTLKVSLSDAQLSDYVDLDRYPIHRSDSAECQSLVEQCREMMHKDCICILPGFLRDAALEALSLEIRQLESRAHKIDYLSTMYGWMNNAGFPAEHPRSKLLRRNCGVITTDQLDRTSHCAVLYHFDELTEFIRRLLQYDTLYRSACPVLSIQVNVMRQGEQFNWHYDTNDGVVSFMIQNPDAGGSFECVPLIRSEQDENYPAVDRIVRNLDTPRRLKMPAGAFTLFMGRRSLHRVAPVGETERARQSLLFSYDRLPGMVFPEKTRQYLTGKSSEPYLGALTPV